MKNYKDLLESLPPKSVVITTGRFNPPSSKHDLLIKIIKKTAVKYKADHYVFVSDIQDKKNPLEFGKKLSYLNLFFQNTNFVKSNDNIPELISKMKNRYKHVYIVSSEKLSDKITKAENITYIPAPETDDSELIKLAAKGSYKEFKRKLPITVRDLDAKRLMNDIRFSLNLEPIKEQINLVKDDLREAYFRGDIFNEGDIVESADKLYKIIKRGSNHLLLQTEEGKKVSKWIQDVQISEREFMENKNILVQEDGDTSRQSIEQSAARGSKEAEKQRKMLELKANQAKAIEDLKSRQARETEAAKQQYKSAANESVESPTVNKNSKYNIAKSVMSLKDYRKMHGEDHGEQEGEHENNMDHHVVVDPSIPADPMQKLPGHTMVKQEYGHQHRRMKVRYGFHAEETSEQKDSHEAQLKRFKDQTTHPYKGLEKEDKPGKVKTAAESDHPKGVNIDTVEGWKDDKIKEDFDDLDALVNDEFISLCEQDLDELSEDEIIDIAFDDEELAIIDEDTGEFIEDIMISEVLSRQERIKASRRMRVNTQNIHRAEKVAVKRIASPDVANRRARRMAVSAMRKRLLRGVKPSVASIGQKERVERFIQQRRQIVDRLAARMVSRVKQVEKGRLTHKKFTKPNNGVGF